MTWRATAGRPYLHVHVAARLVEAGAEDLFAVRLRHPHLHLRQPPVVRVRRRVLLARATGSGIYREEHVMGAMPCLTTRIAAAAAAASAAPGARRPSPPSKATPPPPRCRVAGVSGAPKPPGRASRPAFAPLGIFFPLQDFRCTSRNEGSICVPMTWRSISACPYLADDVRRHDGEPQGGAAVVGARRALVSYFLVEALGVVEAQPHGEGIGARQRRERDRQQRQENQGGSAGGIACHRVGQVYGVAPRLPCRANEK